MIDALLLFAGYAIIAILAWLPAGLLFLDTPMGRRGRLGAAALWPVVLAGLIAVSAAFAIRAWFRAVDQGLCETWDRREER